MDVVATRSNVRHQSMPFRTASLDPHRVRIARRLVHGNVHGWCTKLHPFPLVMPRLDPIWFVSRPLIPRSSNPCKGMSSTKRCLHYQSGVMDIVSCYHTSRKRERDRIRPSSGTPRERACKILRKPCVHGSERRSRKGRNGKGGRRKR